MLKLFLHVALQEDVAAALQSEERPFASKIEGRTAIPILDEHWGTCVAALKAGLPYRSLGT